MSRDAIEGCRGRFEEDQWMMAAAAENWLCVRIVVVKVNKQAHLVRVRRLQYFKIALPKPEGHLLTCQIDQAEPQ